MLVYVGKELHVMNLFAGARSFNHLTLSRVVSPSTCLRVPCGFVLLSVFDGVGILTDFYLKRTGQMYLCDFGATLPACTLDDDSERALDWWWYLCGRCQISWHSCNWGCTGPFGTPVTAPRLYSWSQELRIRRFCAKVEEALLRLLVNRTAMHTDFTSEWCEYRMAATGQWASRSFVRDSLVGVLPEQEEKIRTSAACRV